MGTQLNTFRTNPLLISYSLFFVDVLIDFSSVGSRVYTPPTLFCADLRSRLAAQHTSSLDRHAAASPCVVKDYCRGQPLALLTTTKKKYCGKHKISVQQYL